jgi:hypothetical protein
MPQPSPVADYLDALTRALAFDPALARRVRRETADHLGEAVERDGGERITTEARAVAAFGDAHMLARRFAAASLMAQTRRTGAIMIAALGGIYLAMKGRIAWYGIVQWGVSDEWRAVNTVGVWLDRWAFLLALVGAVTACGYIATRRAPPEFHRAYGHQLGRCVMLCAAAAAALLVTVAIETVLTGCRLYAADFSAAAAIPALTLAVELALTGVLVVHIHAVFRRARCAATLLDK